MTRYSYGSILGVLLALLSWSATASAGTLDPKVEAALASGPPGGTVSVIVAFDAPETVATLAEDAGRKNPSGVVRTLRARADRTQGGVRGMLQKRGKNYRPLWIINALAVEADPALVRAMADQPGVKEVRLNETVRLPEVRPAQTASFWNLNAVRAPELWSQGITGAGVTVAILDSGVDGAHPLLGPKWRKRAGDWFNPYAAECTPQTCTPCEANASTPCDDVVDENGGLEEDIGHGTAVAGIILGGNEALTTGVAPGANWIAAKIFRDDGFAEFAAIHDAFQWALDPNRDGDPSDAPAVVNNSWGIDNFINGCPGDFRTDVQALKAAGIAVVFAGGNSGPAPATSISPGNYPESLAVGAVDANGALASFSARGPSTCDGSIYPEVSAPGVQIHTAFPSQLPGGGTTVLTGTSFSAPHLSGVIALLKQGSPGATVANIENAIRLTAQDLGPVGPDNGYGYGLVNAAGAFQSLQTPAPAELIFPAEGATTEGSVTFRWLPGTGADGQPVNDTLFVSTSPDFSTNLASGPPAPTLLAGAGGLLIGLGGLFLRRKRLWSTLLVGIGVVLLVSCSGGSGDGDDNGPAERSQTVSGLSSGVTYHWKIVSQNAAGSVAETPTRTFTVR